MRHDLFFFGGGARGFIASLGTHLNVPPPPTVLRCLPALPPRRSSAYYTVTCSSCLGGTPSQETFFTDIPAYLPADRLWVTRPRSDRTGRDGKKIGKTVGRLLCMRAFSLGAEDDDDDGQTRPESRCNLRTGLHSVLLLVVGGVVAVVNQRCNLQHIPNHIPWHERTHAASNRAGSSSSLVVSEQCCAEWRERKRPLPAAVHDHRGIKRPTLIRWRFTCVEEEKKTELAEIPGHEQARLAYYHRHSTVLPLRRFPVPAWTR